MDFKLKEIWKDSGEDVYQLLQEIPLDSNWISNEMNWKNLEEFEQRKITKENESLWIWLKSQQSPITTFCFFIDDKPVWIVKLMHELEDWSINRWWNIWYVILPSARNKWYWTKILELTLEEAKRIWLKKVLLTCKKNSIWSCEIIEKNGWILQDIINWKKRYWIGL